MIVPLWQLVQITRRSFKQVIWRYPRHDITKVLWMQMKKIYLWCLYSWCSSHRTVAVAQKSNNSLIFPYLLNIHWHIAPIILKAHNPNKVQTLIKYKFSSLCQSGDDERNKRSERPGLCVSFLCVWGLEELHFLYTHSDKYLVTQRAG